MAKSVLFLFPYPLKEAPSQRFRFVQYLGLLQAAGIDYKAFSFLSDNAWNLLYRPGNFFLKFLRIVDGYRKRIALLLQIRKFDFVFIHREAAPMGPPVLEWIIAKVLKKKIIYDFDDAIWLPNFSHSNRAFSFLKGYGNVKLICRWAYKISCGNQYLCDFAAQYNSNVVYNPTTIDTEHHHNKVKDHQITRPVVGWTGSHSTLRYLLEIIPVLRELEKEIDFEFRVIADVNPEFNLKHFSFVKWNKETEIDDLLGFDVGVMPLVNDKWANGKCGFKALQYMALGIPALVSPVGVNTRIVDHGINGFICHDEKDWYKNLLQILSNHQLLVEMGQRTRKKIVDHYSVQSNAANFLNLFH
jgi:glycosyltransferase involved in cell wall biosynthesis